MTVAVVGSGIAGLSAARFLAMRGHSVTLFEQFDFLHDLGSSHGRSRIVRRAYPDALYTVYMNEAYPLWSDLQRQSDLPILYECGLIYFGSRDSAEMESMIKGLDELNLNFRVLNPKEAARIMPQLYLDRNEIAVHTPEAGWVQAENALKVSHDLALKAGATLNFNTKASLEALEKEYDAYIVCAGPWIKDFLNLDVEVTKHTFAYFEGTLEGPVWIEDSADNAYGFPSEPGLNSFKIGIHCGGEPWDPTKTDREPSTEAIAIARSSAERRFGFENPAVLESKGCLYTSTATDDFRVGRLGSKGFFASACSGHGFKFGPWIGKLMADFVDGADKPERYPRFAIGAEKPGDPPIEF